MRETMLDWDSSFFGFGVASLQIDDGTDENILSERLAMGFPEVLYIYHSSSSFEHYQQPLLKYSAKFLGEQITFCKAVEKCTLRNFNSINEVSLLSRKLLELAYASGHRSRFSLDPSFRPFFHKLYHEWIRNSIDDPSVKVFTLADAGGLHGFATASVVGNSGKIGLIATAEKSRGLGVGLKLLQRCEQYYDELGIPVCRVVTQSCNLGACKLYSKAGYVIESTQCVWHLWNR